MGKYKEISGQQLALVDHYFENNFNKAAAMRKAGYAEASVLHNTQLVFGHHLVVKEIAKRRKKLADKHELTQDWIIKKFMDIIDSGEALAKFKKVMPDGSLTWDFTGATVAELSHVRELGVEFAKTGRGKNAIDVTKFKVKEPDVHAALMALSRHLGLFNDSIEVKGSLAEKIQAGRDRAYQARNAEPKDEVETVH